MSQPQRLPAFPNDVLMPAVTTSPTATQRRPVTGSFEAYKREQSRIARRKMYPLTVFYTTYSLLVALIALRSRHPFLGLAFYSAGVPVWTLVEYAFHRHILHGRFPPGEGLIRRFMHERLDPLHWDHHERPFDGLHISGALKDLLPLFFVAAPLSFLFPVYTLPSLLAGVVQSYVGEEWMHYFFHFGKSRNPCFRYLKRYHLYHHSPRGIKQGYGISCGIWDFVFHTQYPPQVRSLLFDGGRDRARGLARVPARWHA